MKTETNEFTTTDAEITNECTCLVWEDEAGYDNEIPSEHCYGSCWEDALEDWKACVGEFVARGSGEFVVSGFPLWDRTVIGHFDASDPEELLSAVTVRGSWKLRYSVGPLAFRATIWHHDVPTGGTFTVSHAELDECSCEIAFTGHCPACLADAI